MKRYPLTYEQDGVVHALNPPELQGKSYLMCGATSRSCLCSNCRANPPNGIGTEEVTCLLCIATIG